MGTTFIQKIMALFLSMIALIMGIFGINKPADPPDTPPAVTETKTTEAPKPGTDEYIKEKAQKILSEMTLNEKIGQIFIVAPEHLRENKNLPYSATVWDDNLSAALKKYPAGGIIRFAGNISTPEQVLEYNEKMQAASKIPLFTAIDEEGGRVARIGGNSAFDVTRYPGMESIGNTGETKNAYEVGKTIGAYLKKYGFNLDFAPVADINTNPENRVIGNRAFGSTPELVSDMVGAAIDGFHDSDMITCIKHFPGHGDTKGDTHTGYVSVSKTWDELKKCELIPFEKNSDKTDLIMLAHITMPNITQDGLPASLSKEIVTGKLRNELGFDGVITTDSLGMGAITQHYTSSESAVNAFSAGVDIILMPANYFEAYRGIQNAVNNGTITEERLNESVMRILSLKIKYGIIK